MFPRPAPDRRAVVAGAAAALLTPRAWAGEAAYDAVVAKPGSKTPRGKRFDSLAAALAAAPLGGPFRIWLGAGEWREKLTIRSANVAIVGEHRQRTRLSFDAAAGLGDPDGKPWGTFGSATLTVLAPGFRADALTIENGFDPVAEAQRGGPMLGDRPGGQQAVALALGAGSDSVQVLNADILGRQDTLLVDAGRALFDACLVTGTVDFVTTTVYCLIAFA
ncbi:MAG: pectinesterase family protein, partial [Pseudomonadota bacterium]